MPYTSDLQLILKEGADYIVGIKGNQGTLETEICNCFTQAEAIGYDDPLRLYMKTLDVIVAVLLVIGGLNWGLVGFFKFDLVAAVFGTLAPLTRIIYCSSGSVLPCIRFSSGKSIQARWK
jgi:uncharacterized membrane protein YuzA (DUF378 family)